MLEVTFAGMILHHSVKLDKFIWLIRNIYHRVNNRYRHKKIANVVKCLFRRLEDHRTDLCSLKKMAEGRERKTIQRAVLGLATLQYIHGKRYCFHIPIKPKKFLIQFTPLNATLLPVSCANCYSICKS